MTFTFMFLVLCSHDASHLKCSPRSSLSTSNNSLFKVQFEQHFKDGHSVALSVELGQKGNDKVENRGKDDELGATKTTRVNHFPVPIQLRHDASAQCLQINLWRFSLHIIWNSWLSVQ